jgi:hypothetical protein
MYQKESCRFRTRQAAPDARAGQGFIAAAWAAMGARLRAGPRGSHLKTAQAKRDRKNAKRRARQKPS